jgi:lipooligosaccharide transport system permease protein
MDNILYFPRWGLGIWFVWKRNFLYFRRTLLASLSWIFLEPVLLLTALGYGLGHFVSDVNGQPYPQFIAPAMVASTGLFVSFFEGTYGTYTKLNQQNTLQTIVMTPVSTDEVGLAEILWSTTKAMISVFAVLTVTSLLGLIPVSKALLPVMILFLFCWGMSAFAVWIATISKSYDWFIYFQSGFVTPMSLFCGTYFPLDQLPKPVLFAAYLLPLTHVIVPVRWLLLDVFHPNIFLHVAYLILFATVFTNLACARLLKRLVV